MSLVCLSLTGRTISENLAVLDLYRGQIDLCELRADFLEPSEKLKLRSFPERAGLPCILSVRRKVDGGAFEEGEGVRLVMIAKGLSFARAEKKANFAYVDLETDFRVPAVEEVCRIFGTRIIRSNHRTQGGIEGLEEDWAEASEEPDELPKLVFTCQSASELARLYDWSASLPPRERIVLGMGEYGFPSRILAAKMGSLFTYTSALGAGLPMAAPGHLDPQNLLELYRFRSIGPATAVYAVTGGKIVTGSRSPELHNAAFDAAGLDAVYLPFPAEDAASFLSAAEAAGVRGASITVPLKESIFPYLAEVSEEARRIGACNTIARGPDGWIGHNTDALGFERSLGEFLERERLEGLRATIVGAGGAARAVASVLSRLGAAGLVLNRSAPKARSLARSYGFAWAPNDERAQELVADHADLIINATSLGMEGGEAGDPLDWYEFSGREAVYDLIYKPQRTALLQRARNAGCAISNGWSMLRYQAAEQFRIWTGLEPPSVYSR